MAQSGWGRVMYTDDYRNNQTDANHTTMLRKKKTAFLF